MECTVLFMYVQSICSFNHRWGYVYTMYFVETICQCLTESSDTTAKIKGFVKMYTDLIVVKIVEQISDIHLTGCEEISNIPFPAFFGWVG